MDSEVTHRNIHFISGLPRSGSTLLAALLRQNPRFHAGITSPIGALYSSLLVAMSGRQEYHSLLCDQSRASLLSAIFHSYYDIKTTRPIIFDTGRAWTGKMDGLIQLFGDIKIICCVREIPDIIHSFEKILSANPHQPSRMFDFRADGNIYSRSTLLMSSQGLIGAPHDALRDAVFGKNISKLAILPYEIMCSNPKIVMEQLYEFIGEPIFEHDFDNVEFEADEFDAQLGTPGLHRVTGKVERRNTIRSLPPDIIKKYSGLSFWNNSAERPPDLRVLGT